MCTCLCVSEGEEAVATQHPANCQPKTGRPPDCQQWAVACCTSSSSTWIPQISFARILFVDFCSAFNTIQRHLLIGKLQQLCTIFHLLHSPQPL